MDTFIVGSKKFKAWSKMRCELGRSEPVNHEAHVWDGRHTIYGPYFCPGWPEFIPKHRSNVDPQ